MFYLKSTKTKKYNRECRKCCYERKLKWQRTESGKNSSRTTKLKRRFGITPEEYGNLYRIQNGLCKICGNPETKIHRSTGDIQRLAVDHEHNSGKIRGLLCTSCNLGIGNFKDSTVLLKKAIEYLNR